MLTAAFVEVRAFADEYPFGKRKGLFLQGPTGVGKTHLAVAALKRLSERGFDVVFFDYQTLLQRIRDSYNPAAGAGDRDAYRTALDAEILMLDDLGAHRATEWVTDTVTQIITHRYNEDKALIATSNLGLPEYGDVARSKDPETGQYRIADTLSDRIGDRAVSRLRRGGDAFGHALSGADGPLRDLCVVISAAESLTRASFPKQNQRLLVRELLAREAHGVPQRRTLDDLVGPVVVTRQPCPHRQVRAAVQQKARHSEAPVPELRHGVENRRLASHAGFIHCRACIDIRAALEQ
jgi:hypothetical protein